MLPRLPHTAAALSLAALACALPLHARAQATFPSLFKLRQVDPQKLANGVLSLMSYTVAPDVTTSSLSISNTPTGNPNVEMVQFGGGFTWSRTLPLFLEGNAAYSRYDPVFVASNGTDEREVGARWNSVSGTGGIGWDFPVVQNWVLRPIFNFTLGHVASDLSVARWYIEDQTGKDVKALDGGQMNAYGLGGSLMLDFEDYQPDRELDMELRYTHVPLRSWGHTSTGFAGEAMAQSASLWARYRAPIGWMAMDRPVRYVLELSHTQFLGSQAGVLGFDQLTSFGLGMELDSSAYETWVTRWRAVLRHLLGPDVGGWSLGLAVSF